MGGYYKFIYVYPNLIFYMKKFEGVMLSAIIITLIVSSAQAAIADSKPHPKTHTFDPDLNLKYEVYLQSVVRDAEGQLLSVSESTTAWVLVSYFPDGVRIPDFADYVIDNNILNEKKIITIDNVRYEKIQFEAEKVYQNGPTGGMLTGTLWDFCGDFKGKYGYQCVPLFKGKTPQIHITESNILTNQWTILRVMD